MAWKFDLTYVDFYRNTSKRTHTISAGAAGSNDGAGYEDAQAVAGNALVGAQALSLCDVYISNIYYATPGDAYPAASALCKVKDVISLRFDLDGKSQVGRQTVPGPDNAIVLDVNRQVNHVGVRANALVAMFIAGTLLISDGDVATWLRDADIMSLKGPVETE